MGIFFTLVTMSVCVYCVLTFNFYDVEKEKINKEKKLTTAFIKRYLWHRREN